MYLSKQEWLNAEKQTGEVENHLLNLAYTILMNNVYGADGYPWSPYRCISPARSLPGFAGAFTGIWNWDSAVFPALPVRLPAYGTGTAHSTQSAFRAGTPHWPEKRFSGLCSFRKKTVCFRM